MRKLVWALALLTSIFAVSCDSGSDIVLDPNTQAVPLSGGTFAFQDDRFVLVMPANSLNGPTNVTVEAATTFPAEANLVTGTAFRMTNNNGATISSGNPARIRIRYPELLGSDPSQYRIFKVEGNQWVELSTQSVNTGQKFVEASTTTFGTFAILAGPPLGTPTIFKTVLNPSQEVGEVVAPDIDGFGTATVTVPESRSSVGVRLQTANLTGVVAAHIHRGRIGENGPIAATLYTTAVGDFSTDFLKTVTEADLNTEVVANLGELIDLIADENAYVNVHTAANPAGAIRGQLGDNIQLRATLTSAQEVPPNGSSATGTATVNFNRDLSEIVVVVDGENFTSAVTMAHIHVGAPGVTGDPIFTLFMGSSTGAFHVHKVLHESDFTAGSGITSYNRAVAAILGGDTYVNVHTATHPSGEIRGQVLPETP